ncbi:rust resistance kinase Lr10-like [Andrographis paniculata]|uniref:rust resistance kinase Lr10-like n=1 Tax=Andrographis paniculata TaxID=175694 RepID=UPI0021E80B48|nr:rust resistance kinase Lr10-like [Andrographis paniculata]
MSTLAPAPFFPSISTTVVVVVAAVLLLLILYAPGSRGQGIINNNTQCPSSSSSCGSIRDIRFPFRLRTDPSSCGYNSPYFQLDCLNDRPLLTLNSRRYYYVQEINYDDYSVRLSDPGVFMGPGRTNLSSCPLYSNTYDDWPATIFANFLDFNVPVAFIHCLSPPPVNSKQYVKAPFCGSTTRIFANSSEFHSYALVGRFVVSDLEELCTVDMVTQASIRGPMTMSGDNSSSLARIYDGLAYGFELSWFRVLCDDCERSNGFCSLEGNAITCRKYCSEDIPLSKLSFKCQFEYWGVIIGAYGFLSIAGLIGLRFVIGFPLLMWLVVYKWRRRHLSMDESIEEFLRSHNTLTPVKYSYSEIKKMTENFNQKLGEGGYGTVYKGKLRSGPEVAVKLMDQSTASEEEFISEVGTIGQIHHVNVVQLIGFCVEGSKYALVYEYMSNGSLDRYIFNQQSLDILALNYETMFEIALGVARGIGYLHHGCNMQILHFDIKPHNILLDEKFNPKISDFGLAQLYPAGGSTINLPAARGTIGYMAPEMFYRNIGSISYKADVYSFGMLLMEMAGRRKSRNPPAEDAKQVYFPWWAYEQLRAGKDIEIADGIGEEERRMARRIVMVGLWCIQMAPSDRPAMNRVVGMLEGDSDIEMPPKPFVAPRGMGGGGGAAAAAEDDGGGTSTSRTYAVDYINWDL